MTVIEAIRRLFGKEAPISPEAVRESFQLRYHHFKQLLSANTRALEAMSEMEEALQGKTSFGFVFVRSRVARVTAQVYTMIRSLDALAPGQYERLYERFEDIGRDIREALPKAPQNVAGRVVVSLAEIDRNDAPQCGTKMAHLGELRNRMRLPVPDGFVVTADAFGLFMDNGGLRDEIDRLIQAANASTPSELQVLSSAIRQAIMESEVPERVGEGIEREYAALSSRLGRQPHLAVRSSALGEDEAGSSYAGQYRTLLNIDPDNLVSSYKEVVAALYGVQSMSYRWRRGLDAPPMCVGFLEMVHATSGGIAYTRDPLSEHENTVLISSTWGRPKTIVDGSSLADRFFVDRGSLALTVREIAYKDTCAELGEGEGLVSTCLSPEQAGSPSMADEEVLAVAETSLAIEAHFGYPQDIEFAVGEEGVVYLQARAVMLTPSPAKRPLPPSAEVLSKGGVRASGGVGAGRVRHIAKSADLLLFSAGDVLVAVQPGPWLATALPSAAAVVTELGGMAGHLASVARDFKVPALFGQKDAVKRLPEGEMVTVDADGRRVLRGQVESLLDVEEKQENLMLGSPVHETLAGVAELITPLTLLDPDDVRFRPGNCATLHDITRFCHEKSVKAMFSFGQSHHFSRYEARQLHVDGHPKQFWVVDLQDGFRTEPKDKWIELGDIASIPMLALWRGMHFQPWDGPPAVNGRGFLSVMFEASMNPQLNYAGSGGLAFKNYFMISREFCSLQSRFGFHFCNVEALIGEYEVENYARFRFFGGAADRDRKQLRVMLIAEVLEEYGFRTKVTEDSLSAGVEGRDASFMEGRLAVLGHMIMHTRQLDMIMKDRPQARAYRDKLVGQLEQLLGPSAEGDVKE